MTNDVNLINDDYIDYDNLEDGVYVLGNRGGMFEASEYDKTDWTRVYTNKIRLPTSKNNVVYLLSDDFKNSLELTKTRSIIIPPSYRILYYPILYNGSYLGRRIAIRNSKNVAERSSLIKSNTKFRPYPVRRLNRKDVNLFFDTSDIYQAFMKTGEKFAPRRILYGFYKEYDKVINALTPKTFDTKLILIDTTQFKFKYGAPLDKNKHNPLLILFLGLFRTRDNSIIDVDIDFLITSDKLFMKFNPARLTPATFNKFRLALFRIMNTNIDDYVNSLSPEEQEELTITDEDSISKVAVDKVTNTYTKFNSPDIKNTLAVAVNTQIKRQTMGDIAIDRLVKTAVKDISQTKTNEVDDAVKVDKPVSVIDNKSRPPIQKRPLTTRNLSTSNLLSSEELKQKRIDDKRIKLFKAVVGDYSPLIVDEYDYDSYDYEDDELEQSQEVSENEVEEYVSQQAIDIINNDKNIAEEIEDSIQNSKVPLNSQMNSPINSERDKELREKQKKVVVKNSTIQQILDKDTTNIPIQTEDKSEVMHTTNDNMKTITFANFDKTYIENLYTKDILACFTSLADKSFPLYVTKIDIKDTSDALNYKDTWYVTLVDANEKKHNLKVDIPKFYDNRFLWIKGNKKMILKQNMFLPLVKDTPDTVILTTNDRKIFISRKDTKSFSDIERLFKLIAKLPSDDKTFISGDSSSVNTKFISVLEYDEISKSIFSFKTKDTEIYFNREYIKEIFDDPDDIRGNEFLIGYEKNIPILINHDTGLDRNHRTIIEIISDNLDEVQKSIFDSIKSGTRSVYADSKISGRFIPVIILLMVWNGFKPTLDRMGIKWEFIPGRVKEHKRGMKYIRFKDGYLEYENSLFSQLMFNGLNKIKPELFNFEQMESEESYIEYLRFLWGNYTIKGSLISAYEFLIDPITAEVCKDLSLPSDPVDIMIYAVKLLSDNSKLNKASDKMFRVRSIEAVSAILYSELSKQYDRYTKNTGKVPMTIPREAVIKQLLSEKTIEDYSTINPSTEIGKASTISSKGVRGSNSADSYTEDKRSYDESSIGKLAMQTSNDKNVGINRTLVVEPTISGARGYRSPVDDIEDLKDVNIFSPVELLTPATVRNDDPVRSTIASKQSGHVVPTEISSPALISNGYDEAIQYHLSSDFVIIAEEDGEVVEVNDKLGFVIVRYKSGKTRAINTNPDIVKNGGGGFYLSNTLKPTVGLGDKFEKDKPLAYHDKYFTYSNLNGLRHNIGPIVKVAFMSSADTYEDAGICTSRLSKMITTDIVYRQLMPLYRNSNVINIVNIGDKVRVGDNLIQFDTAHEDSAIVQLMSKLSEEEQGVITEDTRNSLTAKNAGTVVDIKIYSLHDPSNLTPSLGKIVSQYWDKGKQKKRLLNKYDPNDSIVKAGYLLTDTTQPTVSRYNDIKGIKTDVLIEFFISHPDQAGVGDKIVLYGPNKQIISSLIPGEGELDPFSEYRPDESIDVLTSPGTIQRRMVSSVIPVAATMKIMIELKRKIKDMIES